MLGVRVTRDIERRNPRIRGVPRTALPAGLRVTRVAAAALVSMTVVPLALGAGLAPQRAGTGGEPTAGSWHDASRGGRWHDTSTTKRPRVALAGIVRRFDVGYVGPIPTAPTDFVTVRLFTKPTTCAQWSLLARSEDKNKVTPGPPSVDVQVALPKGRRRPLAVGRVLVGEIFYYLASKEMVGFGRAGVVFTRIDTRLGGIWHGRMELLPFDGPGGTGARGTFAAKWCGRIL